jgi:UDP-glucose 4-epimerase
MFLSFVGVRDYIHVMDLASGHVAALGKLKKEHLRLKVDKSAGMIGLEYW